CLFVYGCPSGVSLFPYPTLFRSQEAIVTSSDGVAAVLQVWRAADLKGFPLQISSAAGPATISLSFSKIRLEVPPSDLFLPPDSLDRKSTRLNSSHLGISYAVLCL